MYAPPPPPPRAFGPSPPRNHSRPPPAGRGVGRPLNQGGRPPAPHRLPCPPHPRRLGPDADHADPDDRRVRRRVDDDGRYHPQAGGEYPRRWSPPRRPAGPPRGPPWRSPPRRPAGPPQGPPPPPGAPPPPRGGARSEDQRAPHAALDGAALRNDRRAPDTDPLAGAPRDDRRARLTTQGVGHRGHRSTTTGARTALGRRHPRPRVPTGTPARASRGQPVGTTPPVAGLPRGGRRRTRCSTVRRSGAASHPPSHTAGTRTSGR